MESLFVPYIESLELKQLGFDEPCFAYYEPNGNLEYIKSHILKDFPYLAKNSEWKDLVAAQTFSQAFRFFREKYGLHSEIRYQDDVLVYGYMITEVKTNTELEEKYRFTYEEAEHACLCKLIEIVKTKQ